MHSTGKALPTDISYFMTRPTDDFYIKSITYSPPVKSRFSRRRGVPAKWLKERGPCHTNDSLKPYSVWSAGPQTKKAAV